MVSIHCRKCGYRKEKSQSIPAKCPYCDSADAMIRDPSAQDIIESVEEEKEDF